METVDLKLALLVLDYGMSGARKVSACGVGGRRGRARRRAKSRKLLAWLDPGLGEMSREHTTAELVAGGFLDPSPIPLGYRERRRRAKLRRRAARRTVCEQALRLFGAPVLRRHEARPGTGGWWATAEGRRAWLEADRSRKRTRRRLSEGR